MFWRTATAAAASNSGSDVNSSSVATLAAEAAGLALVIFFFGGVMGGGRRRRRRRSWWFTNSKETKEEIEEEVSSSVNGVASAAASENVETSSRAKISLNLLTEKAEFHAETMNAVKSRRQSAPAASFAAAAAAAEGDDILGSRTGKAEQQQQQQQEEKVAKAEGRDEIQLKKRSTEMEAPKRSSFKKRQSCPELKEDLKGEKEDEENDFSEPNEKELALIQALREAETALEQEKGRTKEAAIKAETAEAKLKLAR